MISKKVGVLAGFLFLIILFLGVASAESCIIKPKTTCESEGGYAVMGLSDSTNAHGQLRDATSKYTYVLCCDFERSYTCTGTNTIINLSDITNAHAEIPDPTSSQYTQSVCYGNFVCTSPASCADNEMGILSLSSETNAHIGGFSDYDTKICCAGIRGVKEAYVDGNCKKLLEIYWADPANPDSIIYETDVILGITTVRMVMKYSELIEKEVTFKIYEDDGGPLFDDKIKEIIKITDSNGNANASWTISEEDLEKAFGWNDRTFEDLENFYFKVNGITEASNDLNITVVECDLISLCMNYDNENECQRDICKVAANSTPEGIICGGDIICGCSWDSSLGECGPSWEATTEPCGWCGDGLVRLDWEECDDGNHGNNDD